MSIARGYLLPHAPVFIESVGGAQSKTVEKSVEAYKKVAKEIAQIAPDLIIVISPHGPVFTDAISLYDLDDYIGNFKAFGDFESKYKFHKDELILREIYEKSENVGGRFYPLKPKEFKKFQFKTELDHGVLVPLHFISQAYSEFKLLAMSYGTLSYSELMRNGEIIRDVVAHSGKKTVIIASGDMSHALKSDGPYTYHEDGVLFDKAMCEYTIHQQPYEILRLASNTISHASECGLRSLAILLGCMNHLKIKSELLSYEGPFGVGYLFASYNIISHSIKDEIEAFDAFNNQRNLKQRQDEHDVVKIARITIENYIKEHKSPKMTYTSKNVIIQDEKYSGEVIEKLLSGQYGTFVSLKRDGNLRGCIGTILPTQKNGIEEIIKNAISACSKDYRFEPLEVDELSDLTINVDILSPLSIVENATMLDPKKFGVIVSHGNQMGVLLPDIEGIKTVDEQLTIASNKGGFRVDEIDKIERFTVERYF